MAKVPTAPETWPTAIENAFINYENLDNAHMGVHDYFKFLKYGFGRATDLACMAIRRGRLSRDDALALVKEHDGRFPSSYLGVSLEQILDELQMTSTDFIDICDRFTNKRLFVRDRNGNLVKDRFGNLEKVNYDNEPSATS